MHRKKSKMARKIGLKPGALLYVGEQKVEKLTIDIIDYDAENLTERHTEKIEDCLPFRDTPTITWININGIHDVTVIEALGKHFDVHPLVLEDIINTSHRPKLEETDKYVFVVLKMLYFAEGNGDVESEQVSVLFGGRTIISFQEKEGDVFAPVRERLRKTVPRVRFMGADYLAYTLLDAVVDHYFVVLETIGEEIEVLEDELVANPTPEKLEKTHALKRQLINMRKAVWPLREVVGGLERNESAHIQSSMRPYL
ncbi:MAG TPA: magnesium and cobalt transport protein CorA, partial [Acidobacteriota bacterium]|nr:magnesium and cobalt transport protein CorA [Acidobacteriota bacterium]